MKVDLVALHITESCTHSCPMCYISASKGKNDHGNISDLHEISKAIIAADVKEVTLLGGDPAKHPDVLKISKFFSDNGIYVSILSNTLAFRECDLPEIGNCISGFEATIHSHSPEEHDLFCKSKGAFNRVTDRLRHFSDKGKKVGVAINVTPQTCASLFNIIDVLVNEKNINLDYVILQRIIPLGRATETSNYAISRDQAIESLYEIQKVEKEFNVNIVIEDPFPMCILPEELHKYIKPCQWGETKVSISSSGELSRCGADPRYRLGNILKTPLIEIWNNAELLNSFRNKEYLPGRCQICNHLEQCGGGCPLSCEIEKDHGIDYLYSQYEENDVEVHGELKYEKLKKNELSSVLQIEWLMFAGYGHVFSVDNIRQWYKHNPDMFYVVKDKHNWILGYAVIVPVSKQLYKKICSGLYSSLIDFPARGVIRKNKSEYCHIEVIATIYGNRSTRAGSFLIKKLGETLLDLMVKHVTASPIKDVGVGLCNYFDFKHSADEEYEGSRYPIYKLDISKSVVKKKLARF